MKESECGEVAINFEQFNRTIFVVFLAFIYTGEPTLIDEDNWDVLFEASQFYQVCWLHGSESVRTDSG